jgi:hypothetical protein
MIAPLTPLQQSARDTGRRFFAASEAVYSALCAQINALGGYPVGAGSTAVTEHALPEITNTTPRTEDGRILVSVETWRITESHAQLLNGAIQAGQVAELLHSEFQSQKVS